MSSPSLRHRVADEVRVEMARQRKTGVQLAELLQCSQQSASRRMTGHIALTLDEIAIIANWLQVEPDTLIPWPAPALAEAAS